MENVAVSVIIPVFNSSKYIKQCIDSILEQSLKNWELILVDDHSTDNSYEILCNYQKKDKRIKVLQNEGNNGAGSTRNIGINCAKGEYLLFLDSDDFFDKDLLSNIYRQCYENDLDICIYDYAKYDEEAQTVIWRFSLNGAWGKKVTNKCFNLEEIGDEIFLLWSCAPWTRMIKRDLVMKTGIRFQELHNANDIFFTYATLANATCMKYVTYEKPLLYYRVNVSNQLTNTRDKAPYCIYQAIKKVFDYYSVNYPQYMSNGFYTCLVQHLQNSISSVGIEARKELLNFYREEGLERLGIYKAINKGYILDSYRKYIENISESQNDLWIQNQGIREEAMFKDEEKTKILCSYLADNQYRSVLWGGGKLGKLFLKVCNSWEIGLCYVVDMDEKKWGLEIENYIIKGVESCKENIDVVLITNTKWLEEIRRELRKLGSHFLIIDLYSFYGMGLKFEECIFQMNT